MKPTLLSTEPSSGEDARTPCCIVREKRWFAKRAKTCLEMGRPRPASRASKEGWRKGSKLLNSGLPAAGMRRPHRAFCSMVCGAKQEGRKACSELLYEGGPAGTPKSSQAADKSRSQPTHACDVQSLFSPGPAPAHAAMLEAPLLEDMCTPSQLRHVALHVPGRAADTLRSQPSPARDV